MLRFFSKTPEETFELGRKMAKTAVGGEIILLYGDLGAGKTMFTKGYAKGLGVEEVVTSPTFTLVQSYQADRLMLHHFDLYRLEDPEEAQMLGFFEMMHDRSVCLIEWPQVCEDMLPQPVITVRIDRAGELETDGRNITIDGLGDDLIC